MKLETFFEKFDQFADAPDAVKKMRELVRYLAVTGTLVVQDNNDEPALVLLDRIAAHKTALAKEGKLRGATTVSPMSPDEGTTALPSSWTWVRFGEIMVNRDGERIPVNKEERATRAKIYDYYGASGVIDKIDGYLFDKPLLLIGEDGANLINRSTPIAFMARGQYWVNNHAHVLDGISEEFLRYIELYINAINLELYVTGSAQPKMNQAKMNSIPIAVPPLAEQKRIVAKVDELMALCDQLEAQQQERATRIIALAHASLARFTDAPTPANLNFLFHKSYDIPPIDLRKSILTLAVQGKLVPQDPNDEPAEMFLKSVSEIKAEAIREGTIRPQKSLPPINGDEVGVAYPASWAMERLGNLTLRIGSGSTPHGGKNIYVSTGLPFLRSQNIWNDGIRLNDVVYISEEIHERMANTTVYPNDILLNITGASLGRSAVAPSDFPEANVSQHVTIIRAADPRSRWFIHLFLVSPLGQEFIWTRQVGMAREGLSKKVLELFEVPVPPLAEQGRIVAKVDQLMALVDELERQLAASRAAAPGLGGRLSRRANGRA